MAQEEEGGQAVKLLSKQIEATSWTWEGAEPNLWEFRQLDGAYEVLTKSGNSITARADNHYIDLAGMTQQEKTLFIEGLQVEYQVAPSATDAIAGDQIEFVFMVTDQPVGLWDFANPGFASTTLNAENCALFQQDVWAFTQDSAAWSSYPVLNSRTTSGSMMATASDRLYLSVYQRVITKKIGAGPTSTLDNILIPGFRFTVNVTVKEEELYRYMMRLRRSFELQQAPDRD
jgi:hypothetical protein